MGMRPVSSADCSCRPSMTTATARSSASCPKEPARTSRIAAAATPRPASRRCRAGAAPTRRRPRRPAAPGTRSATWSTAAASPAASRASSHRFGGGPRQQATHKLRQAEHCRLHPANWGAGCRRSTFLSFTSTLLYESNSTQVQKPQTFFLIPFLIPRCPSAVPKGRSHK